MSGWKGFSSLAYNDKSQITFSVQHLIERNTKQRKNAANQSNRSIITKIIASVSIVTTLGIIFTLSNETIMFFKNTITILLTEKEWLPF